MTDTPTELTETERKIAAEFSNVLDMAARLMTAGDASKEYFYEKFSNLVDSSANAAELLGITPGEFPPDVRNKPSWDLNKVWHAVSQHSAPTLDQVWTALQYDNPYYAADYPPGGPRFHERPYTLDDAKSSEWHVQYKLPEDHHFTRTTVRGHGPSDAVRNTRYLYPHAESARIDLIQHPEVDS